MVAAPPKKTKGERTEETMEHSGSESAIQEASVKEEKKRKVIHGQEPELSTSTDLMTVQTVTFDDETEELIKLITSAHEEKVPLHALLALWSKFKEVLQQSKTAAEDCEDSAKIKKNN